jgi:hypothetical protein
MGSWRVHVRGAAMVVMAAMVTGASAQGMYRCSSGGSTYLSDRPCGAGATSGKLAGYGPTNPSQVASTPAYTPPVGKAPDHLAYLSPACASINDAIRTGPARGLKSQTMNDLHTEYRTKCSEDESEARQKLSRERADQRAARRTEQAAQQAEQTRTTREREQCQELLRILHVKRQRLGEMSVGEKGDFERSEANFHARCAAR